MLLKPQIHNSDAASARDLCGRISEKLPHGECHAYDFMLSQKVSGKSWFYLLLAFSDAESTEPLTGMLFVAPSVNHSAKVAEYFDGGTPSVPIRRVVKPAKVMVGNGGLPVELLERGLVE